MSKPDWIDLGREFGVGSGSNSNSQNLIILLQVQVKRLEARKPKQESNQSIHSYIILYACFFNICRDFVSLSLNRSIIG